MNDVTLNLDSQLQPKFPDMSVGAFLVADLHLAAATIPGAAGLDVQANRKLLDAKGMTVQNVSDHPLIASWRKGFMDSGLKASTYKSSAEQLARRCLKGEGISTPLPIVNAYCAISTRHLAPLGGYDLARLPVPEITLRYGDPDADQFHPLGGRAEDMPIRGTIPVYASGREVLCWAFNHRDSSETCLLPETTTAVFVSEAITPLQREAMTAALTDLANTLKAFGARCGEISILDTANPLATLSM